MIKISQKYQIVCGALMGKDGIGYIDPGIPKFSPKLKDKTGKPANLHKYLMVHEGAEAKAMKTMPYLKAHTNIATPAEKHAVEADGVNWKAYTKEIDGYLDKIEHQKVTNPPPKGLGQVNPEAAISHHRSSHKNVVHESIDMANVDKASKKYEKKMHKQFYPWITKKYLKKWKKDIKEDAPANAMGNGANIATFSPLLFRRKLKRFKEVVNGYKK